MPSPREVEVTFSLDQDGAVRVQMLNTRCSSTPLDNDAGGPGTMQLLLEALHPKDFLAVLKQKWVPSSSLGSFAQLNEEEILLHTIPLFQKLVSCLTSTFTDLDAAFACADLISQLCLGPASSLLLQPKEVLTFMKRLVAAKRRETREGALRCMTSLIKENLDYCKCFVECSVLDYILDQIDYESEVEVATYACKSVLSLVRLVAEDETKIESLLSRALPSLIKMLGEKDEVQTQLDALCCLDGIRHIGIVASALAAPEHVRLLTSLLKTDHAEIQRLALDMFGAHVTIDNSEDFKALPVAMSYALLREIYDKGAEELEVLRLNLMDCLLGAVHTRQFTIEASEAQFLSEIILHDTKACASKAIDIMVVAWDLNEGMASDLAKKNDFLAQLPHAISVTQAALNIIHFMIQADVAASEAMAQKLGAPELRRLRVELQNGRTEVQMIVLDVFLKVMDQENRCADVFATGILEDVVQNFDSESITVRKRCWTLCARLIESGSKPTAEQCVEFGLVPKTAVLFKDYLDHQEPQEDAAQQDPGLDELFAILQSVSGIKSGARAICDAGILSRLLEFVTPRGIVCQEIHDVFMNVLTTLPVKTSRLLAEHGHFGVLAQLVTSRSVQLKRLGFEILKSLSFKECTSYLTDSNIIPELCAFLGEANPRLKADTVFVLCKMAKFALDQVCESVVQTGVYSALFTVSRSVNSDSTEMKMLPKIFQKLKSLEATKKAEKTKAGQVARRLSSFGSMSVLAKDRDDLVADLRKASRVQSISFPAGRCLKLDSTSSKAPGRVRRPRQKSCDSDIPIKPKETPQSRPSRLEKITSLGRFANRRTKSHT